MRLALALLLAAGVAGAVADKPPAALKKPAVKSAKGGPSPPRKPQPAKKTPPATPAVAAKTLGLGCSSGED